MINKSSTLKLPSGELAGDADRVMVQSMWAIQLANSAFRGSSSETRFVFGNMGRPSYPASETMTKEMMAFWYSLDTAVRDARQVRDAVPDIKDEPGVKPSEVREDIVSRRKAVLGYGDPQGDLVHRERMAKALTDWYAFEDTATVKFKPSDILFTTGGAGALRASFEWFQKTHPGQRLVTTMPYYPLHAGMGRSNNMHYVDVMQCPGYTLTAEAIQKALMEADALGREDGGKPGAFILCDPNNPTGRALSAEDYAKIADVFRDRIAADPEFVIILDEAYAEMADSGKAVSLLQIAPELANHAILMRSATKALSGAGDRMAIAATTNPEIMSGLLAEGIGMYGHAPRSGQCAYSAAMESLASSRREREVLVGHYKPQVDLVWSRLEEMAATMPDASYRPNATFYALTDLGDLIGQMEIPKEAEAALGRSGVCWSDEDVAYALMFKHGVSIAPGSYFGIHPGKGYFRITCSDGDGKLEHLCNVLREELLAARKAHRTTLKGHISTALSILKALGFAQDAASFTIAKLQAQGDGDELPEPADYVPFIERLRQLRTRIMKKVNAARRHALPMDVGTPPLVPVAHTPSERRERFPSSPSSDSDPGACEVHYQGIAAEMIQSALRPHNSGHSGPKSQQETGIWAKFVLSSVSEGGLGFTKGSMLAAQMLRATVSERLGVEGWKHFLDRSQARISGPSADTGEEVIIPIHPRSSETGAMAGAGSGVGGSFSGDSETSHRVYSCQISKSGDRGRPAESVLFGSRTRSNTPSSTPINSPPSDAEPDTRSSSVRSSSPLSLSSLTCGAEHLAQGHSAGSTPKTPYATDAISGTSSISPAGVSSS